MVKWKFLLIPFASRNIVYQDAGGKLGYRDYFIFGIRVARIQQTTPW